MFCFKRTAFEMLGIMRLCDEGIHGRYLLSRISLLLWTSVEAVSVHLWYVDIGNYICSYL
jgi:hypothetical protein